MASANANAGQPGPIWYAPIDWTDEVFDALKARVRQCAATAQASLAAIVPTLLATIDRQQEAQRPATTQARRQREQQQQLAETAGAELRAIATLPNADDQITRLGQISSEMAGATPAIRDQIAVALGTARERQAAQAQAAEEMRREQQASQAARTDRQRSSDALTELKAIGELKSPQEQLVRLGRGLIGASL